jgi:hypothetical protein
MIVYFDTNVLRDLSEKRGTNPARKTNALTELVKAGKVTIAPSFEVLYELLSAPSVDKATRINNAQFYVDMVDWKCALKPSEQILQDDIYALSHRGGPSTPYRAIDKMRSDFIQSIKKGEDILPAAEWTRVVTRSRQQNEKFVRLVFNNFVTKLPSGGKTKLRKFPEKTWNEWWAPNSLAEFIANALVVPVVGRQMQQYNPLVLPTVRAAVGYILDTWYCQTINHVKSKPTLI